MSFVIITQSNNIQLDHSITHDDLNISISRKLSETPMNTNDLSSLTDKTEKKINVNKYHRKLHEQ